MIRSFLRWKFNNVSNFVDRDTHVLLDGECAGHRLKLRGHHQEMAEMSDNGPSNTVMSNPFHNRLRFDITQLLQRQLLMIESEIKWQINGLLAHIFLSCPLLHGRDPQIVKVFIVKVICTAQKIRCVTTECSTTTTSTSAL